MKRVIFSIITILFTLPGLIHADSAYGNLQAVHEKNTVMKGLRKVRTPQGLSSDEVWEKMTMADMRNQQHTREAILATQRNNQNNYWEAFDKVKYPDLQVQSETVSRQRESVNVEE